jgi:hypothetical protein
MNSSNRMNLLDKGQEFWRGLQSMGNTEKIQALETELAETSPGLNDENCDCSDHAASRWK